jgi:thiol-disulfide isomerase/thioredoxin
VRPRFESVLNLLLAVACVAVTAVAIQRFLGPAPSAGDAPQGYAVGERFPRIDGIDYSSSEQTLVMFLASTCRYCTESAPFYADLVQKRDPRRLRLIAVGPEPAGVLHDYLQRHAVTVDSVASVAPDAIKARGTPTLVLVDRNGRVRAQWIGALRGRERQVQAKLFGQGS